MPHENIDVITAYDMITNGDHPNLIILDVRTQSEYDKGHLEKALLIPLAEFKSRFEELSQYKDSEIIVYCHIGGRSYEAANILSSNNFNKVYNVLNGIKAWESAKYPIITESK